MIQLSRWREEQDASRGREHQQGWKPGRVDGSCECSSAIQGWGSNVKNSKHGWKVLNKTAPMNFQLTSLSFQFNTLYVSLRWTKCYQKPKNWNKNQMEFSSFNQGSHCSYAQLLPKNKRRQVKENLDNVYLEELQRL